MTEQNDPKGRPHGETGDTVQQAAEVTKPTSSTGGAPGDHVSSPIPPGLAAGTDKRPDAGSDAMPGQSNAL